MHSVSPPASRRRSVLNDFLGLCDLGPKKFEDSTSEELGASPKVFHLKHLLQQARKDPKDVTPQYEDAGLFKTQICTVRLDLVPVINFNRRGDIIIRCFVKANLRAEVLFAGRRVRETKPLVQELNDLKTRAYKAAVQRQLPVPDLDGIRLQAEIEGAWRRRLFQDKDGWEKRAYQLVAARCIFHLSNGSVMAIGMPPETQP